MKIFVWGIGGREHAIINSLCKSNKIEVYALRKNSDIYGNVNYIETENYTESEIIGCLLNKKIDLVIVGSEELLAAGVSDKLSQVGILCFGPKQSAAKLESSKIFAKNFMCRHKIPTASHCCFTNADSAKAYLSKAHFPLVIKADGLAKGKGVVIVENYEKAVSVIDNFMVKCQFGSSGQSVVVEEMLKGPELSMFVLFDGKNYVILPTAIDYKKSRDGNIGENTGGMGAISPNPYCSDEIRKECEKLIIIPTLQGLIEDRINYVGCLYFGLILTDSGPKVLEYNCRFGDPETQAILPLINTDLSELLFATASGNLNAVELSFNNAASCCVVITDQNYPESCNKGQILDISSVSVTQQVHLLFANVKKNGDVYVTDGGRILNIVAIAENIENAKHLCYNCINNSKFERFYFRKDIGLVNN